MLVESFRATFQPLFHQSDAKEMEVGASLPTCHFRYKTELSLMSYILVHRDFFSPPLFFSSPIGIKKKSETLQINVTLQSVTQTSMTLEHLSNSPNKLVQ